MSDPYSLHGKRMRVLQTAESGVVGSGTRLVFEESDSVITARYDGGAVVVGYLVGRRTGQQAMFRYAQISTSGEVDGGVSQCDLAITDGRLRLHEHFRWESRTGEGLNVFEELLAGEE